MANDAKKELKIGLIGFGSMGKTHAYCVSNLPYFCKELDFGAKIAGVCTRSIEKSQKVCRDFGFEIATCDENDLIYNDSIDVIDICTPNICHYETLKKAISAGKNVLCEKPLCTTPEEAAEILEISKKYGKTYGIVFNNRHLSPVIRAKQLIDEGKLGKILSFNASYLHSSATDPKKPVGWKQNKDICGGGVLFDLGSHAIDLIYYLCGDFESVIGKSQIAYPVRLGNGGEKWETNADEAFYMIATLSCGAVGTIRASKVCAGTNDDLSFEIYGEKGALKFSLMDPNRLYFCDGQAPCEPYGGNYGFTAIDCIGRYEYPFGTFPSQKAPQGWLRGHIHGMYRYLSAVSKCKGEQFEPSFEEALHVQKVMEAAYRSDADKAPCKVI